MDEGFRRQAQDWFDRGDHDIQTAELLYDQRGHTDAIAYLVRRPFFSKTRPQNFQNPEAQVIAGMWKPGNGVMS